MSKKAKPILLIILFGPFVAAACVYLAVQLNRPAKVPIEQEASKVEQPAAPEAANTSSLGKPDRGPTSPASHLSGPLGHLEHSADFTRSFLQQPKGHRAFLNFTLDASSFQGSLEEGFFVLWDQCTALLPAEAPSALKCSGWSIRLDSSSTPPLSTVFYPEDDNIHLRGNFRLGACDGPHQGLMGCVLTALIE